MNKLSEEQINEILVDYDVSKEIINKLEDILEGYTFNENEYYNIIVEIVSEYQSYLINKSLNSDLARPYNGLKDIIIKVLKYKLKNSPYDDLTYETEIRRLILTVKQTH